jgi:serine/threonine-protein kinase
VKPSNLFVCADGRGTVKVLDLGISMMAQPVRAGTQLTTASTVLGTPAFSSPEQLAAPHEVDQRADIWSLGVTLYVLVSGVRPFVGESLPQLCASIFNATPPPLDEAAEGVPRALAEVVARCLAKDPEQRFSDVQSLARALEPFAAGARGVAARIEPARVARTAPSRPPPAIPAPPASSRPPAPPSRAKALSPFLVAAIAGIGTALIVSMYFARGRTSPGPIPTAAGGEARAIEQGALAAPAGAQDDPRSSELDADAGPSAPPGGARPRSSWPPRPSKPGHARGAATAPADSAPRPDPGSYR